MHQHIDDQPFPRFALIWAAGLIAVAIVSAATARLTDIGATRLELAQPVFQKSLVFSDLTDGQVQVSDAVTGRTVAHYAPGQSGFIRVVLRSFAFNRARGGVGAEVPFTLSERTDGTFVLEDPATQHVVTLDAFGHANAAVFKDLLRKGKETP
jgi:putative photosynthetic complex assembly protein